jgi:myo-inositol 2-dehydrogenase/D-chiro-inositol 1-dehydrogenase
MVAAENQRPVSIEIANAEGYTRPPLHDFFMTRYTAAYAAEITAFIDSIENNVAPSPSIKDGLVALKLADAALKSTASKAAVKIG